MCVCVYVFVCVCIIEKYFLITCSWYSYCSLTTKDPLVTFWGSLELFLGLQIWLLPLLSLSLPKFFRIEARLIHHHFFVFPFTLTLCSLGIEKFTCWEVLFFFLLIKNIHCLRASYFYILLSSPVGWGSKIYQLHLFTGVRPHQCMSWSWH